MDRTRLDNRLVQLGLANTRSQAESHIKLELVEVNGKIISKCGYSVKAEDRIQLNLKESYVSRAGLKLASVAKDFGIDFKDKVVLDVGSSTGGFTDFALRHGASMVIAVESGTNQMNPQLASNPKVELHEKTDIRQFSSSQPIDIVLIDVSFISLRLILPNLKRLISRDTLIIGMVKPQFETNRSNLKNNGVIKNERMRREILSSFEIWVKDLFVIKAKQDSKVAGQNGNIERFYLLQMID